MKTVVRIMVHEWLLMWRSRAAAFALVLVAFLSAASAFVAMERARAASATRERLQSRVNEEFVAQPARHPHRMVHYGHFAFRPIEPLAAFDPGIDGFAGNVVYLEGHRQNSANFADIRQSSLLLRFGELTPALVLQVLMPLLLIVLGSGIVARDRERGTLRLLLSLGASPLRLACGKSLAIGMAGIFATAPALLALAVLGFGSPLVPWAVMVMGYGLYLVIWIFAVVWMSSSARSSGAAVRYLLGAWAVMAIVLPRVASEVGVTAAPSAARFETELAVQRELRSLGDSHDENDPYFAKFKQRTLERHGVARVEDLPVNYLGLLALEGERMTSELFDQHAARQFDVQQRQVDILDGSAVLTPVSAIRRVSMTAAQSDLRAYRRFVEQAERYRYDLVQSLNRLQAEAVTFADDSGRNADSSRDARTRIDPEHWRQVPAFQYSGASTSDILVRALPALGILFAWTLALGGGVILAWRRFARGEL